MSKPDEEFMRRIQDQFDKIVDSVPHKSRMSESEKLRQQEIKNRKAEIKKEFRWVFGSNENKKICF